MYSIAFLVSLIAVNPGSNVNPAPVTERVTTLPTVVIVGRNMSRKVWTCGDWTDSSLGGQYRSCEYR